MNTTTLTYKEYLQKQTYSKSTITVHLLRVQRFIGWIKNYGITADTLTYKELMQYVKYLKEQKKYKVPSINNELRAVKLYYDYLIFTEISATNPAEGVAIRGTRHKVISNILSTQELEDLYYSCATEHHDTFFKAIKIRNKVVLGLMIYQGIKPIELYHLELSHVQLHKGSIYIPGTKRSNPRTLVLHPSQILAIQNYTENTRMYLANRIKTENTEQLIYGSTHQMNSITHRIISSLKKYNAKLKNVAHLRTSIIVNWLSKHHLRKVQYMAGHRYISSTERYKQDDLENLQEIINKYHPIS